MRPWVAAVVLALSACPCLVQGAGADDTSPFDQPVQTRRRVVARTVAQYAAGAACDVVRCSMHAGSWLRRSIPPRSATTRSRFLPLLSPAERPACQAANRPGEMIVPTDTWGGYFLGVKAGYLLLSAEDGVNGGMGFAVMRSDEPSRLLFQDLATLDHDRVQMRAVSVEGERLRLRYTRLFAAPCSVQTDRATCWARIVAETHVPPSPRASPDCAAGYLRAGGLYRRTLRGPVASGRCRLPEQGIGGDGGLGHLAERHRL